MPRFAGALLEAESTRPWGVWLFDYDSELPVGQNIDGTPNPYLAQRDAELSRFLRLVTRIRR